MTDAREFPLLRETLAAIRCGASALEIAEAIKAWFTIDERLHIATAALRALPDDAAELFLAHALADIRNGPPVAPLDGLAEDAWAWCDLASHAERSMYLWSTFHSLPLASRKRFLGAILAHAEGDAA